MTIEAKAKEAAKVWDEMVEAAIRLREPLVRVQVTVNGRAVREAHVVRYAGRVFLSDSSSVFELEDIA